MNEKEIIKTVIDKYVDLQRIKYSQDRDAEIELQESVLESQLAQMGITDLQKFQPKH